MIRFWVHLPLHVFFDIFKNTLEILLFSKIVKKIVKFSKACVFKSFFKNFVNSKGVCVYALRLSKDVVLCSGAGERYAYRRNPGWTLITFTNLKRPSSRLTEVKGWFSSKGFFQIDCCGKKFKYCQNHFSTIGSLFYAFEALLVIQKKSTIWISQTFS